MSRLTTWIALSLVLAAALPALAEDEGPADCNEDEVFDEARAECVDAPEDPADCRSDEVFDEARGECVDAPEDPADCDPDEAVDPTTGECERVEDPEDSSSGEDASADEPDNGTERIEDRSGPSENVEDDSGPGDDVDEGPEEDRSGEDDAFDDTPGHEEEEEEETDDEDCDERESEQEREETLSNGTRYRERVRTKVLDCPGTANDRTETRRDVRWHEEDDEDHGSRATVAYEKSRGNLSARVDVPAFGPGPAVNVSMEDNASALVLADPRGAADALKVAFLEVVEFEDADGDGGFDLDDVALHTWRVRDLVANATSRDDDLVVTYALPPGGDLSFVYRGGEGRAKFDIVIDGFAYASPTSQLALRTSFEANEAAYREDLGDPALTTRVGDRLAFFDWTRAVEADGVAREVVATVYVGDGAAAGTAQLYLAYPHAARVVHDPSLGFRALDAVVETVQEVLFHPEAYAAAVITGLMFVGVGFAFRRGR